MAARWLGQGLALVERLSPDLASDAAFRLWCRTGPRPETHPVAAAILAAAQPVVLPVGRQTLRGFAWGSGPAVLLVHGWGGASAQLTGFVHPLTQHGFRVVAFDLPAHGRNPGSSSNVFEAAAAIGHVSEAFGPIHGIVGHSFGALASTVAIVRGLSASRVVAVASPALPEAVFKRFGEVLGLSPGIREGLYRRLEQFAGPGFWSSLGHSHPALILHDRDDREVPFRSAEVLAEAWPRARLRATTGLGHHRILRDPAVIAEIVGLLTERAERAERRASYDGC